MTFLPSQDKKNIFLFLTSTILITLIPSKLGDQDMAIWSLISDFEVLKHHQSDVEGDTITEIGRGSTGQKSEADSVAQHKFLSMYDQIL